MEIKVLSLGMIGANCYLLSTKEAAVVIDPGFESKEVLSFLESNSNKQRLILLTHAHFDHIGGANILRTKTNTKIGIGKNDNHALLDGSKNLSTLFNSPVESFSADILFDDNEEFSVGDITFRVIETPGHTPGGVCYLTGNTLFSGDTLFNTSIGRTDFPGGNFSDLQNSVQKLYTLHPDTVVFSGHGEKTTIGYEKKFNPFIRG